MIATHPTTELVKTITACRACGSASLDEVLDLGTHAVSDFYATVPADELRAPLCLVQCGGCGLVQLTHSVSKDRLYSDYWYRSGLNPAMVAALKDVVDDAMGRIRWAPGDTVIDIGANDGTLLDHYPEHTVATGFEPSQICQDAKRKGHLVVNQFYPPRKHFLPPAHAKIITSIAVFYDLDDPNAFVKAIKEDLHPEGVWVNQMMDLEGMLYANAFDNICHEHVGYWSLYDFIGLINAHDLHYDALSRNDVNGGSLRMTMRHGRGPSPVSPMRYQYAIRAFASRIRLLKDQCLAFLEDCRYNGKTVLGLGASTKFNTLLQYYGIDSDLLPAIMERNPDKVGKVTAGSHIPIISEEEGRQRKPDYLLIGPWHFLDNLIERERDLITQGARLVAPLPTFRVL